MYTQEQLTEAYDILSRKFPERALKERTGGMGKKLKYLDGHTVRRRMVEATKNIGGHKFRLTRDPLILDLSGDKKIFIAFGAIEVAALGMDIEDIGVQIIQERAGEDMWKGAVTDCYKRCAAGYLVGSELYGEDLDSPEPEPVAARNTRTATKTVASTPRARLMAQLKEQGVGKESADTLATEKFGVAFAALNDEQITDWLDS